MISYATPRVLATTHRFALIKHKLQWYCVDHMYSSTKQDIVDSYRIHHRIVDSWLDAGLAHAFQTFDSIIEAYNG